MQLQGKGDRYDMPQSEVHLYTAMNLDSGMPTPSSQDDLFLSEEDCDFLLKYIGTYLPYPDNVIHAVIDELAPILDAMFASPQFQEGAMLTSNSLQPQRISLQIPLILSPAFLQKNALCASKRSCQASFPPLSRIISSQQNRKHYQRNARKLK